MKSIRLALVVYFLVLLGLGLAAVSCFVYRTTQQTLLENKARAQRLLEEKQAKDRELLLTQYDHARREEHAKLDAVLQSQALTLATLVRLQSEWYRGAGPDPRVIAMSQVGQLAAGLSPAGAASIPIWIQEGSFREGRYDNPLSGQIYTFVSTRTEFNEDALPRYADGQVTEYFQINSEWGTTWRSKTMGNHVFQFDSYQLRDSSGPLWQFDELTDEIKPGETLRRVTLKAPSRMRFGRPPVTPPPPSNSPSASREQRRTASTEREPSFPITILIQCACDTRLRDQAIANLTSDRDAGLRLLEQEREQTSASLESESEKTLSQLQLHLLGIALATFAATVFGGFWLVRLGLLPLRRLSEAVSKVSEKDFQLRVDDKHLPGELQPIVERLKQTLEALKRAFAREKQAAADISHELRTPLAALLTTIEVALRKPRSSEEYRDVLGDCHATGKQISQLVERLLALARLDAGVDRLRPQQVDVAALAEQCTALIRPLAEARGLSLRVHCSGPAPLTADPDKLREVLTNLLHNAIEYNKPNGAVDLTVQRDNGTLRVEVTDTGVGITPEAREHIFERFYRADPARQADGLHAGLGLAIVKGYIDLMGGRIAVASEVGQGSTFRVQLPA